MKILYRVVAVLAALLTIPTLIYLKLIHIVIEFSVIDGFLDDSFSIKQLYDIFTDNGNSEFKFPEISKPVLEVLAPLKEPFIVTCVFAALLLICILAVLICSAFTNARKVNCCLAGAGILSSIGLIASFNATAGKILDGTVSLSAILNASMSASESNLGKVGASLGLGNLTEGIGSLIVLQLHSAIICTMIIFIFILLWTLAFIIIDSEA